MYLDGLCPNICFSALLQDEVLPLSVSDNGQDMEEKQLKGLKASFFTEGILDNLAADADPHVGLLNSHRRIVLMCGAKYGVYVDRFPGRGTTVYICLHSKA